MKRLIAVILALMAVMMVFSGCEQTQAVTSGPVKTGLAVITSLKGSKGVSEDTSGAIKYDITVAAVTVDDNGYIHSCYVDVIGAESNFDANGVITTDLTGELLSKGELGDNYGMKAYAGSKYEWYEQVQALTEYVCGKTIKQIKKGAVNEVGYAKDADLASTATIYIGGYVDAIEQAVKNAKYLGAQKDDAVTIALISSRAGQDASAEEVGKLELNTDLAAITMSGNTVTSCIFDGLQIAVEFDANGQVLTKPYTPFPTKNELGEGYGMKAYAGSQYEWNEQAAFFAEYVSGKTMEQIGSIALTETTAPAEADLASTVTITVGRFLQLLQKAAE